MSNKTKKTKIGDKNYIVRQFYGYNDHYYVTIYTIDGEYMGQLVDCQLSDYDLTERLTSFVKSM